MGQAGQGQCVILILTTHPPYLVRLPRTSLEREVILLSAKSRVLRVAREVRARGRAASRLPERSRYTRLGGGT